MAYHISLAFPITVVMVCLASVASECRRQPVIFNFGDSNSDTGGFVAAAGLEFGYPYGRTFFHHPAGRACDGRLIIDFLCESLETSYLKPYLDSLRSNFSNGVNFAVSGAAILPRNARFNLGVQINQFVLFYNRSLHLRSKGHKDLFGLSDFENAVYTIDIGQNDLTIAFNLFPYHQVLENIPSFISQIKDAMWAVYRRGGRNFWVHNTGPLGCLPEQLGTRKPNSTEIDEYGCISILNEGAKTFNSKLYDLCQELRLEMERSTIVYVDVYSIKHGLYVNPSSHGFEKPLMACCGYGGPPYNYDPKILCVMNDGYNVKVCEKGRRYISWDGTHYTESANEIVAAEILSKKYSTLLLDSTSFCDKTKIKVLFK